MKIHISTERLTCISLIEQALADNPSRLARSDLGLPSAPVHVIRADDVLYLPDLRLQILKDHVIPHEGIVDPWNLQFVKNSLNTSGKQFEMSFEASARDEDVCILSNVFSRNFGHWTEELLKVVILERFGFKGRYVVSHLPSFAIEFLLLLGVAPDRIDQSVAEATVFGRAWYTTPIGHPDVLRYPNAFFALRDALLATDVSDQPGLGERLWLDRTTHTWNRGRELINIEEIHSVLERHGFRVVDMGALGVRQQIAAAKRMKVLTGPHGAQFVHAMFMEPRSTVVECFSPLFVNPSILEICHLLRHRYFQVVPVNTPYEPYAFDQGLRLNPLQLDLVLSGLE